MIFYVDAWGDPVGSGASVPRYCTLGAVAKFDGPNSELAVANEFICGRLGQLVGVPIPPGVIVQTDDGKRAFVTLRFGKKGERPPPVVPEHLVADHPSVAGAIVAFDCWIGNADRHAGNIAYAREGTIPPAVFDHANALLGTKQAEVEQRLARLQAGESLFGGCLNPLIRDGSHVLWTARRIGQLPADFIAETCSEAERTAGLPAARARLAQDALIERRQKLVSVLRQALPNVTTWGVLG